MTTVFLADDHSFFRSGLAAALVSAGYQVVGTAADGVEALAEIPGADPQVVILDLRMPNLDGVATLEALRARGDRRAVIVLATEISEQQATRLIELGAESILLKHGNEETLLKAIDLVGAGARMIEGQVLDSLVKDRPAAPDEKVLDRLTPRESVVAAEVAKGKRNREIAEALGMTEGTVKVFLHGIYAKLGISSRTELAVLLNSPS